DPGYTCWLPRCRPRQKPGNRQSATATHGVHSTCQSFLTSSSSLFIQWFMYISAMQISEASGIRSVYLLASSRLSRDSRRSLLRSSVIGCLANPHRKCKRLSVDSYLLRCDCWSYLCPPQFI